MSREMRKFMICNKAVITPGPIIIKIQIRCHTLILQEFSSREYTYILCVDLDSTFFLEIARRPEMFTKS